MDEMVTCPACYHQFRAAFAESQGQVRCVRCEQVFYAGNMQIQAPPASSPPPRAVNIMPERLDYAEPEPPPAWKAKEDERSRRWDDRALLLQPLRPTRGVGYAAIMLLGIEMLFDLITIPLELAYHRVLDRLDRVGRDGMDLRDVDRIEDVIRMVGIGQTVAHLATIVVFLVWVYRSYANLASFGAEGLATSPGWAVGSYFIPILNLFRPYQVMQETFKGSDPKWTSRDPRGWKSAGGSPLVVLWWLLWLASNVLNQVAFRLSFNQSPRLQDLKFVALASVAAAAVAIPAGICLIVLIYRITARQEEKALGGSPEPFARDMEPDHF